MVFEIVKGPKMENIWKGSIWPQFGAAIKMLENAITACPEDLWSDRTKKHEFWYMVYHTLFWLDFYLSESADDFRPPEPFTMGEMDPAGVLPERVYAKPELLTYLEHGRAKCRTVIETMTDETAARSFKFGTIEMSFGELLLYNMRHVQHHAAQLNLLLRQNTDSAPRWVKRV